MVIKEGTRITYNDHKILTEFATESELVGDRIYKATAYKNGVKVNSYKSCVSFEDAVEQLKPLLDFKLSVDPIPTEKLGGKNE